MKLPKIIGHRGCGNAPENTVPALHKAKQHGLKWVEFDVCLAKCGTPVIFHDSNLRRTSSGRGAIKNFTYKQLKKLDAGSWFSADYKNTSIPSLVDFIKALDKLNLQANVEIKPTRGHAIDTAEIAYQYIEQYWPRNKTKPLYSSFCLSSLTRLRALDDKLKLGLLLHEWRENRLALIEKLNCFSAHLNNAIITEKRVKQLKERGVKVAVYTVNSKARAEQLWRMGVDSVFTDFPRCLQ